VSTAILVIGIVVVLIAIISAVIKRIKK